MSSFLHSQKRVPSRPCPNYDLILVINQEHPGRRRIEERPAQEDQESDGAQRVHQISTRAASPAYKRITLRSAGYTVIGARHRQGEPVPADVVGQVWRDGARQVRLDASVHHRRGSR